MHILLTSNLLENKGTNGWCLRLVATVHTDAVQGVPLMLCMVADREVRWCSRLQTVSLNHLFNNSHVSMLFHLSFFNPFGVFVDDLLVLR